MKVDLDKVKEILEKYTFLTSHLHDYICQELDELAYGTIWKCLNCGKDIYFNTNGSHKCQRYYHVSHPDIRCNTNLKIDQDNIAIPKPEDNYSPIGDHEECLYCGKPIYFGMDEWYHCGTDMCECVNVPAPILASLHRAKPKPKKEK